MADKKTYVFKILTFVLCAVVSLSVFWRGGMAVEAADGVYVFHEQSPNTIGTAYTPADLYVGFGETLDYTLSFSGYTGVLDSPKMVFYFFDPYYTDMNNSNSADNWYAVWVDNWRMTIGGNTYKVSYLADSTSVFNIPLPANASFHYLIECDVHIRLNNAALLPNQEIILNETHTEQSTSTSTTNSSGRTTTNTNTSGSSTMHGYASDAIPPVKICPIVKVALNHSGDSWFNYTENTYVTDAQQQALTQQQTQQQHSDAQNQLSESQKQTAIQEEQKETTKGIFNKISSFFASFFENIINAVASMVLPDSDELMTFLDEVNTWFGDRLGFIYYPFDLAVQLVQAFALGDANQQFSVPALTLNILGEQYAIWESFTVDLDAMGIFVYVRYFTSAMLCLGVGKLAVDKWDDWIGGKRS